VKGLQEGKEYEFRVKTILSHDHFESGEITTTGASIYF
jgi:hypothetical protein